MREHITRFMWFDNVSTFMEEKRALFRPLSLFCFLPFSRIRVYIIFIKPGTNDQKTPEPSICILDDQED